MNHELCFACVVALAGSACFLDLEYQTGCKPGQVLDGNVCRALDDCAPHELPDDADVGPDA